jgi:hypothetical protein
MTILSVGAVALGVTACGGDDGDTATPAKKVTAATKPANAATCTQSWNATGNAHQQALLAGVAATDIVLEGHYRVGTWPKGAQTVPVTKSFSQKPEGEAVVKKGSCVVVLPDTTIGQMAFAQSGGKWVFVAGSKFPKVASKSATGTRSAQPDALGQLKLG